MSPKPPPTPIRAPLSDRRPLSAKPAVRQGGTGGVAQAPSTKTVPKPLPKIQLRLPLAPEPPKKIVLKPRFNSGYDPEAHGALCSACPARGRVVVPPTPNTNLGPAKAAIVGMEPGWEEIRLGRPFEGRSGKKLEAQLTKHGLHRDEFHVTNAALCLPQHDEDRAKTFKCCAPRLKRELDEFSELHPEAPIITLGAPAFRSAFGRKVSGGISKARGFVWTAKDGRIFLPTIHPAFVLRDATQAPLWNIDWNRIARYLDGTLKLLAPPSWDVPRTPADLRRFLLKFKADTWVAVDIETTKQPPTICEMHCVGISNGKDTVVVPWYPWAAPILNEFFRTRVAVGHNIFAFDAIVLRRYKVELPKIEDTLIAHHAFASHYRQGMDHLMSVYADVHPWKIIDGMAGKDEKGQPKNSLSPDELHRYNALDCYFEAHLWMRMQKDIQANLSLYEHDKGNAIICREMTENGVRVDEARRKEISDGLKAKIDRLLSNMRRLAGWDFDPNKTVDIRKILFEQFGAPIHEWTEKTHQPSTSKRTLQDLAVKHDRPYGQFSADLVMYRMCSKVRATHVDKLPIEADGRVHSNWKSFGTPTGRLSVSKINMNNMKRADARFTGEPEYRVREIYAPAKDHTFVAFDLEQIEPRISAYLSGDAAFIAAVETGDIHTAIARIIFGDDDPLLQTSKIAKTKGKHLRQVSKSVGLACSYAAEAATLHDTIRADGLDITLTRVIQMLDKVRKRFHRYFDFIDEGLQKCRKHGFIIAGFMSGRKRWLGHAPEAPKIANTPCQGGAADVMNYRMQDLYALFKRKYGRRVKMIAQVYDSVVAEVPLSLAESVEADMRMVMAKPWVINGRSVVLPIEIKIGDRLSEV